VCGYFALTFDQDGHRFANNTAGRNRRGAEFSVFFRISWRRAPRYDYEYDYHYDYDYEYEYDSLSSMTITMSMSISIEYEYDYRDYVLFTRTRLVLVV